jgi:RNA ligase (TIGR02306 family)
MSVEPDSCLARVVKVVDIIPIPNANSIQCYVIPGWEVIGKIGEFDIGELAIHCMINTIFPDDLEITQFLKGKRLKTRKILGQLSQGLLLPISVIDHLDADRWEGDRPDIIQDNHHVQEDDDLTHVLKLRKWVPKLELDVYKDNKCPRLPSFIPKTNEERVQNCTKILPRLSEIPVTITEKRDGTSTTYVYMDDTFIVAGRNFIHTEVKPNNRHYFEIADKYDLRNKKVSGIAIQGEITGPKIGGNRHGLTENQFHVFNIYSIDQSRYLPWDEVVTICKEMKLPHVRVVYIGVITDSELNLKYFMSLAQSQRYENGKYAEGIVVKSNCGPRISFKVISNQYLLKYGL